MVDFMCLTTIYGVSNHNKDSSHLPKYIKRYVDRLGKIRTYYRRGKYQIALPLGANEPSPEYIAAASGYSELIQAVPDFDGSAIDASVTDMVRSVRNRAKRRGIDFDIDREWVIEKLHAANYRCAVTGMRFSVDRNGNEMRRKSAPSLDRIDCTKGYTRDNVRIVLASVNIAMNEWGAEHLFKIALAAHATR